MADSDVVPGIDSFVAIGDSFTEGLEDPDPGGGFRGWADRVAGVLSAQRPGFRYANLAIRGKLLGEVVAEQLPRAVELAPDLVSLAAGGNDILRGTDVDVLAAEFEPAVAKLQAAGCRVLIFTGFDPRMFPVIRLLRGRIATYDMHLRGIADDYGCDLVDLWSMRVLKDKRAWSPDRLHLTHRRPPAGGPARLRGPGRSGRRGLAGAAAAGGALTLCPPLRASGPANRARWRDQGRVQDEPGRAERPAARREDARWAASTRPRGRAGSASTSSGDGGCEAPRPAPRPVGRPGAHGDQPVRSARTSSRRASEAAIQGKRARIGDFSVR